MTPHMYVLNHMVVPLLAWYLRIRIGWGTGRSPTSVPCWRNLRISDSSVSPLMDVNNNNNTDAHSYHNGTMTHTSQQQLADNFVLQSVCQHVAHMILNGRPEWLYHVNHSPSSTYPYPPLNSRQRQIHTKQSTFMASFCYHTQCVWNIHFLDLENSQ